MTDVRKVSPWRRFIAVLTSFVLAVMGAYAQGAVAHAEENSAIAFGPVTLTHVTDPGKLLFSGHFLRCHDSQPTAGGHLFHFHA